MTCHLPLAVGGPGPTLGLTWDVSPIVLGIAIAVLVRWAGIRISTRALLIVSVAGALILDPLIDTFGISLATACAVLVLAFVIVAARRTRRA